MERMPESMLPNHLGGLGLGLGLGFGFRSPRTMREVPFLNQSTEPANNRITVAMLVKIKSQLTNLHTACTERK